jgi:hypothetical protein
MTGYAFRPMDTYETRVAAVVEHGHLTREAFDALPIVDRDVIQVELHAVSSSGDTRVPRAWRGSYGMTVRSGPVPAPHVVTARELLDRFTRAIPAPVDNSPAGRRARLLASTNEDGARRALNGATIADMREIGGGSTGWKRDQHVSHLVERARIARLRRALAAGDGETLRREYDRARYLAADARPPARTDMRALVETFRGRKLRTCKGTEWGTVSTFVNGHPVAVNTSAHGSGPEGLARAAEQLRRDVIAADERRITDPDAYPAAWYAGAPDADPAVVAYCQHAAKRERADRAALADAPAPAPVALPANGEFVSITGTNQWTTLPAPAAPVVDQAPALPRMRQPVPHSLSLPSVAMHRVEDHDRSGWLRTLCRRPHPAYDTDATVPVAHGPAETWTADNPDGLPDCTDCPADDQAPAAPFPVGSTVQSVHADPFPVRGTVAGYPAPGRVSIEWDGGNTQDMPVTGVRAADDQAPASVEAAPFVSGWSREPFVSGWSALLDA